MTGRPGVGDSAQAAAWYSIALDQRGGAERALRESMRLYEEMHAVRLGEIAFSEMLPGEPRVPPLPDGLTPRTGRLLVAEADIVALVHYRAPQSRFRDELGAADLKKLREITRRQWAAAYRKKPYRGLKPWLSDLEVDHMIDEMGPATAVKLLSNG